VKQSKDSVRSSVIRMFSLADASFAFYFNFAVECRDAGGATHNPNPLKEGACDQATEVSAMVSAVCTTKRCAYGTSIVPCGGRDCVADASDASPHLSPQPLYPLQGRVDFWPAVFLT